MGAYRIREVRIVDQAVDAAKTETLREYERDSDSERAIVEQARHFFELEVLSPKAPQTVDFDALIVLDAHGREIARFNVSDVWRREAEAVNSGKAFTHWA
ncbi:hypothetical protein [Methylocystis bryophila]|uniref:Uncharacterized protein n=1 Tax=Methylocystis bryophila TaxID=655015 RepID=A0A1W6MXK2_9HYPH|nr:hypothetical protein [Methylocystis bryophila]ARN82304.1 hypothetical protein B1812_15770 [Methylocystis bryophila]BDV38455.1 hypothetical protein DSM21852_17080 [Methylocystis bryophila]